ncbi:RNA-directed DNA polymerase from mobile element jockey [Nephila pilipes]|uniref:RNA-directed DNA polymerase from mobile element jockey n=1 Tax=Nephila pilipes TaxID=299642 RepID=A0A8X6QIL8_NEPPI|nr:RNA-directed DNA polymerase from mobile element jockey [Nephila pilipes]
MINRPKQIKTLSWNCNSISNKLLEFKNFLQEIEPDIIALQETRLKPALKLNITNYTTHRTDRSTYAGRGTAVLVRNSIPQHAAPLQTTIIEGMAITLERSNKASITIASVYKSPRKPMEKTELQHLFSNRRDVLVIGDLNAKHPTWNPIGNNNRQGNILYTFAKNNNLQIHAPTNKNYPQIPERNNRSLHIQRIRKHHFRIDTGTFQ